MRSAALRAVKFERYLNLANEHTRLSSVVTPRAGYNTASLKSQEDCIQDAQGSLLKV